MMPIRRCCALLILSALVLAACTGVGPWPPAIPAPVTLQAQGGTLSVKFLDVGQGDSILVRAPDGTSMLIDGGNTGHDAADAILPALGRLDSGRLDLLVITHPDADHINGLPTVVENFKVINAALSGQTHTTSVYERLLIDLRDFKVKALRTRAGTALPFAANVKLEVLWPDDAAVQNEDDSNNASVVIKLTYGKISFLFTGDAESGAERDILASGADVRSTFLKLGHHGSRSSTSEDFLRAVAPKVGIISVGADNHFGHPAAEVLERAQQHKLKVYRTDQDGTICVTTDGTQYSVRTEK